MGQSNATQPNKFNLLSFSEKLNHLKEVAEKAKLLWGYPADAKVKLLNFTENATFSLQATGRPKVILRVHRLEYATFNNIRTELTWILNLKQQTKLSLALPQKSQNGHYIEAVETPSLAEKRYVVCFEYVSGSAPVDSSDTNEDLEPIVKICKKIPNWFTFPLFRLAAVLEIKFSKHEKSDLTFEDRQLYQKIGKIAATLHLAAQKWSQPAFYERMEWNFSGTFGQNNNFYGASYQTGHWLHSKEIGILDQCVELIRKRLTIYGTGRDRYGMIHSDLRTANLLKNGRKITALDFDDCGQGWFMYDLASAVALMEHRPDIEEILTELLDGYQQVRTITQQDKDELWTFIMMRRIGLLQSLIYRMGMVVEGSGETVELTPDVLEFFAKGTVVLAERYLKRYSLTPMAEHVLQTQKGKNTKVAGL
ncbi:phosphotransferase enzyme family protein [Liquorilactobacillus sicerae]|uniref:phosphotransferase enzyme family protein n=1 Tax=Liquorilactobacillus sicerae TaxID=1416943 RepID=UPI0024802EC6|nr:phosphotransferase [Liquorilactobacillus sicerae]